VNLEYAACLFKEVAAPLTKDARRPWGVSLVSLRSQGLLERRGCSSPH
jgi:hypothetical protein